MLLIPKHDREGAKAPSGKNEANYFIFKTKYMAVHALHNKEIRLIAHSNICNQIKTYNEHIGRFLAHRKGI